MQRSLTVVGGTNHGRVIPIIINEFRIGRDAMCHLRPASTDISRLHCAIVTGADGNMYLRDYGSSNGTIVNQRYLIGGEFQLRDGDVIEVGPLMFRLSINTAAVTTDANLDLNTVPVRVPELHPASSPIPRPVLPGLTTISSVRSPRLLREESALESTPDLLSDSNIFSSNANDGYEMPILDELPGSKIAHQALRHP